MRSIMNKVTRFLHNLSNASHIRASYNKAHTVKNRLQAVNIGIGICIAILVAVLLAIMVCPSAFVESEVVSACTVIILIAIWLYGYRRAIAFGQSNRQTYIANSRRWCRRLCRGLGRLILTLVILAIIIIALMVVAQKYNFLTDVFPPLKGIADCIIARLNEVLSNLLAKIG